MELSMPTGGSKSPLSVSAAFEATFNPSWGKFSPGTPMVPVDKQPPRRFDFAVGSNIVFTPRSLEAFGFSQLRAFSNVEIVRLAIEKRKDQIERLNWHIQQRRELLHRRPSDAEDRIKKVTKFFQRPDGVTPFHTWMRAAMEDLLALDAPAFEKRRSRSGELIGLDVIDGATIKVLIDETGRRPNPPAPAYQQIIKGIPWANLTSEDLLYSPRNVRSGHVYGFGPVEQCIVTINTYLRRQTAQLAHFTKGNIPAGLINSPEGYTPDQIKELQDWFDARLVGNIEQRSQLLWAPAGSKYQSFKEAPLKDDFDEWLARIVCFAFSIPPTPFIRQLNRSTADSDSERSLEDGLAPLSLWAKRLIDSIIHREFGFTDLEFVWGDVRDIDPGKQAAVDDIYLRNGSASINEIRMRRGDNPIKDGDKYVLYTANGGVLVENLGKPPIFDDEGNQVHDPQGQTAVQHPAAQVHAAPKMPAGSTEVKE
jgi:hypothetical protein